MSFCIFCSVMQLCIVCLHGKGYAAQPITDIQSRRVRWVGMFPCIPHRPSRSHVGPVSSSVPKKNERFHNHPIPYLFILGILSTTTTNRTPSPLIQLWTPKQNVVHLCRWWWKSGIIAYIWLRNRRSSWRQTVPPLRGIREGLGPSPQWTCFGMHVGHPVLARAFDILYAAVVLINFTSVSFQVFTHLVLHSVPGIARLWRGPGQSGFRQPPVQTL